MPRRQTHEIEKPALLPMPVYEPVGLRRGEISGQGSAFVSRPHALKRIAQPDEIANAVAFFASDAASLDRNSNGKSRCALRA